jgi:BirA family transcriptional regulator, biotin operon repressor / biotin---[acetyl-CoA-carboxylase] ligase
MMHIEYVATIDSTNSELMRRAAGGDYQSVCLVAQTQTAGRGRLGRAWLSSEHALTFSVGLALSPKDWSGLSLAVGLSIAEQLHERVQIKWPNDLWVDGCKLAGILIETAALPAAFHTNNAHKSHHTSTSTSAPLHPSSSVHQARFCVIGVGINLQAPPLSPNMPFKTMPVGLQTLIPSINQAQTLERILQPLVDSIHQFAALGFRPYAERFASRDALTGRQISLASVTGSEALTGQYAGINDQGALLLQTPTGLHAIISQEVSVCF